MFKEFILEIMSLYNFILVFKMQCVMILNSRKTVEYELMRSWGIKDSNMDKHRSRTRSSFSHSPELEHSHSN